MRERDFYIMFLVAAAIFMLTVDRLGVRSAARKKSSLKPSRSSAQTPSLQMSPSPRILCYGDSLTAGLSPPLNEMHPYAPYLEQALHQQTSLSNAIVRHRGLPGWTSSQMLAEANGDQTGLRSAIQLGAPIDVVIILAGTNDLAYVEQVQPILEAILAMHQLCYDEGVQHTIALGIPSSGYQSVNQPVSLLAESINTELANFAQREPRATFVPFPFAFSDGDDKWAPDGLHFTPHGYQVLGSALAPTVESILKIS